MEKVGQYGTLLSSEWQKPTFVFPFVLSFPKQESSPFDRFWTNGERLSERLDETCTFPEYGCQTLDFLSVKAYNGTGSEAVQLSRFADD